MCCLVFSTTKSVNKSLPRLYPKELKTIGDHLRTKRLDLKLRQKDLVGTLGACHATIKNWEKNYFEPQCFHVSTICKFLQYCPISGYETKHFGHQLRNYRVFTLGLTIFDLAIRLGISECTLSELEQSNIIRYTHILNTINLFLKKANWHISNNTKPEFIPSRSKCIHPAKYMTIIGEPKTLGDHIALRRKQLKLKQLEVMKLIGIKSASAYGCWERNTSRIHIKYYPAIMKFLNYCPIQYSKNEGEQLKLFREHLGLSYRKVDKILNLSKGCTYRIENMVQKNCQVVEKILAFYKRQNT